jgi:hypothetical protein
MVERTFWLNGPRVALISTLAMLSMFSLILFAEVPLFSNLQVAVALWKALPQAPLPKGCENSTLHTLSEPLESFDGRQSGYGLHDALNILCAMEMNGEAAKRSYLDRHFPLDMLFPLLYGPALAALWLYLTRGYHRIPKWLRYFSVIPLLATVFDWAENIVVRALVLAGPPGDADRIYLASKLTELKYKLVNISAIPVLLILCLYLIQNSVSRRQN